MLGKQILVWRRVGMDGWSLNWIVWLEVLGIGGDLWRVNKNKRER